MGRHVNFADEQERWLNKADKINRNVKHQILEERDPSSLTLVEQLLLEKRRMKKLHKEKANIVEVAPVIKKEIRYSHYRPKLG